MADLREILSEKNVPFINTNNPLEIKIKCTSGQHEDTNPSLHYNMDKNVFYCFSCGFSGGPIKFLESIGITERLQIESKLEYKILKLKRKLQKIRNADTMKLPKAINKVSWDFKGIRKEILHDFSVFTTSELSLEDYICVPVYQFGRLKFIDARKRNDTLDIPKYMRKPDGISVADVAFPIDKIEHTNHIILVEGMYDMLNMWQYGVRNVLCIFGANNFGTEKIKLLDKIGITKVTIMMDGDLAGRNAADRIQNYLEKADILTYRINLQDDEDPGMLSKEYLYSYLQGTQ